MRSTIFSPAWLRNVLKTAFPIWPMQSPHSQHGRRTARQPISCSRDVRLPHARLLNSVGGTQARTRVAEDEAVTQTIISQSGEQTAAAVFQAFTFPEATEIVGTAAAPGVVRGQSHFLNAIIASSIGLLLCVAAGLYFAWAFTPKAPRLTSDKSSAAKSEDTSATPPSPSLADESWPRGRDGNVWNGVIAEPTKLPGVVRWQAESAMPRAAAVHSGGVPMRVALLS